MDLTPLAVEQGDKAAYIMSSTGASLSYRELESRSNRIAHLFRSLGLRRGDHIALLLDNTLSLFPIVWAAQRSGLYYTPVNWHLTADEAGYVVDNCEARILISSAALEDTALRAVQSAPAVQHRFTVDGAIDGVVDLDQATADLPDTPIPDQSEGSYMFYSSGTTGRPKGILRLLTNQPFGTGLPFDGMMATVYGLDRETVYLSPGPLYHAAPLGWSLSVVRCGGTVLVMPSFDPQAALTTIQKYGVTHGQFVPTMFVRLLKLPVDVRLGADVSTLTHVVHAAAPCPVDVKQAMIDWVGPILTEYYAGSEGNSLTIINTQEWLTHKGSVGKTVLGVPHILDPLGAELPTGEVGEIWFSDGPDFAYHGDPEKTAAAHNSRGWSTLGDLGHLDEDGFLYLSSRRTDLIISGGVNIYPSEIEDVLTLHPAVEDIAVIGLPDEEWGQRVHAVVKPASGAEPGPVLAEELTGFLRERLAKYKVPRSIEFVDEMPRLPSGKLLKRKLLDDRS